MAVPTIVNQKLNTTQTNLATAKSLIPATTTTTTQLLYARAILDFCKSDVQVAQYVLAYVSPPVDNAIDVNLDESIVNLAWAKAFAQTNTAVSKQYSRAFMDHVAADVYSAQVLLAAEDPDGRKDWVPSNPYAAPAIGDFPNSSNTGLAEPSALTPYYGTLQPGQSQVIENLDINGRVDLSSGVVLRNCRVRADDYYAVRVSDGVEGCVFEDCEFDGLNGICNAVLGGGEGSWTMKRCYVHGGEDAIKITRNCSIRDSRLTNNGGSASDPHFDEIQCMVGWNIDIYHNFLEVPAMPGNTSAIILKTDFGPTNPINDVRIRYNYLNGGSHTFTSVAGNGTVPTNIRLDYNRFGPRHDYGYRQVSGALASDVGNVYET